MGHGEATDAHSNVPSLSFVLLGPLCFWDPVPPELAGSLQPSHPALSDKKTLGKPGEELPGAHNCISGAFGNLEGEERPWEDTVEAGLVKHRRGRVRPRCRIRSSLHPACKHPLQKKETTFTIPNPVKMSCFQRVFCALRSHQPLPGHM